MDDWDDDLDLDDLGQRHDLLRSAIAYGKAGLHVFPCQPASKIPIPGSHGCKNATNDLDMIIYWWLRWPTANVAIATGHIVDVIDIDGPEGVQSWSTLVDNLPTILAVASTPRPGGSHLYVAAAGYANFASRAPGIDYRGRGGYVIAPPSINADGVRYRWRRPLLPPGSDLEW